MDVAATIQIGAGGAGTLASGAASSKFGMQVNGPAGNRPYASGDSGDANFQSDWESFLEALGAATPGPAQGKAGSTTSSTSSSIATQSHGGGDVGEVGGLPPPKGVVKTRP